MAPGKPPKTHCGIQSYVIQWNIGLILHRCLFMLVPFGLPSVFSQGPWSGSHQRSIMHRIIMFLMCKDGDLHECQNFRAAGSAFE
jgi:hypothetical protein